MTGRATRFVAVGTVGFFLQMAAAAILLCFGVRPVLATVLAIEAAILSNHAMHRRWTWRDRSTRRPWTTTLRRAHVGAGATSLIVGAGTVLLLADRVAPMAAQGIGVFLPIVAAYDPKAETFGVYFFDGAGARFQNGSYACAGSGSERIRGVFEYIARTEGHFETRSLESVLHDGLEMLDIAADLDSATGGFSKILPVSRILDRNGNHEVSEADLRKAVDRVLGRK